MRRIFITLLLLPLAHAHAAVLTFEQGDATSVFIDSRAEPVNLIEGAITFPSGDDVRVETAGSVIPLWIEAPHVEGRTVRFAGLIPGGFNGVVEPARELGSKGLLFRVYGVSGSPYGSVRAYLHDGSGSEIDVAFGGLATTSERKAADTVPPAAIDVALLPASDVSPRLLVALGDDAETGVGRYEVSVGGEWREFTPPLEIPNEEDGRIAVRIFDHSGNYREIVVQEAVYDPTPRLIVSLLMLLVVGLAFIGFRRRRRA